MYGREKQERGGHFNLLLLSADAKTRIVRLIGLDFQNIEQVVKISTVPSSKTSKGGHVGRVVALGGLEPANKSFFDGLQCSARTRDYNKPCSFHIPSAPLPTELDIKYVPVQNVNKHAADAPRANEGAEQHDKKKKKKKLKKAQRPKSESFPRTKCQRVNGYTYNHVQKSNPLANVEEYALLTDRPAAEMVDGGQP